MKLETTMKRDKISRITFDDWVENSHKDFKTTYWTQVCSNCAKFYHLPDSYLDIGSGNGICGVFGCNNESDHYYDFNAIEI